MQEELVTVEIKDGVADVRLNRPEKYNALSQPMFRAIIETGERLRDEKSLRAVVLSGSGRGFCAGLDMDALPKWATAITRPRAVRRIRRARYSTLIAEWKISPTPCVGVEVFAGTGDRGFAWGCVRWWCSGGREQISALP